MLVENERIRPSTTQHDQKGGDLCWLLEQGSASGSLSSVFFLPPEPKLGLSCLRTFDFQNQCPWNVGRPLSHLSHNTVPLPLPGGEKGSIARATYLHPCPPRVRHPRCRHTSHAVIAPRASEMVSGRGSETNGDHPLAALHPERVNRKVEATAFRAGRFEVGVSPGKTNGRRRDHHRRTENRSRVTQQYVDERHDSNG